MQLCSISLVTDHMTYMASRTALLVLSNHFPVSCSLYESKSLGPLDTSRQCFIFRLTLMACCMMVLLCNNIFSKKERRKENEKFGIFEVKWF